MASKNSQKTVVIGAGPVGALAALYAANRGDEVEVYELRGGGFIMHIPISSMAVMSIACLTPIRSPG